MTSVPYPSLVQKHKCELSSSLLFMIYAIGAHYEKPYWYCQERVFTVKTILNP